MIDEKGLQKLVGADGAPKKRSAPRERSTGRGVSGRCEVYRQ